MGQTTYR